MSRYRPPSPPKSPYITPTGYKALQQELNHLWKKERPIITATVHEAAKNGDRSENGDYIYGKQRLRQIDGRIRYLSKRLDELTIVDRLPVDQNKIYFGAQVLLQPTTNKTLSIRILGVDEINLKQGVISIDSPMAKLLIGKTTGDEVQLTLDTEEATKTTSYTIESISYQTV